MASRISDEMAADGGRSIPENIGAQTASESRQINRIPVRLAVSRKGRSALLGRTRDISLHGAFIETKDPFDVGVMLPLAIELGPKQAIQVQAEVVRTTADGMGLRFHKLDRESARRLRRWIVDHTSVVGSRRQFEQLHDARTRIEPIAEIQRIQEVLNDIRGQSARVTLVPPGRVARDHAHLVEVARDRLVFRGDEPSTLVAGEEVHALATVAFVSWAFGAVVVRVDGPTVVCAMPERVVFSERRTRTRTPAGPGAVARWPSPTERGVMLTFPLLDTSDDGFSFRGPRDALLTPGTRIGPVVLQVSGGERHIERAEVRNVQRIDEPGGESWLRVGVAIGSGHGALRTVDQTRNTNGSKVGRFFEKMKTAVSVAFNKGRDRLVGPSEAGSRRVVVRSEGLRIVGILDRSSDTAERLEAPLVIVVPGFAGRKEQLSLMAGIIVEGFRRQNAEIAVLRIDTTNNLGESGKDPGCEKDGLHCMHHTVSGMVSDVKAALAWARRNPFVDPTHVVIVSMSLASLGVRHVLTRPEGADVGLWFSYMGAADAIDTIKNASGNVDFHAYWMRGEKVGYISVNGVMTDGDHFWRDLHEGGYGYLDSARRDMAAIKSDVVWLRGAWDAFVDPRRVDAIMQVAAPGAREIIDVRGGHLPRTSDEAVEQFIGVTRRIWQYVHRSPMPRFAPSLGKLVLKHDAEWAAVRRGDFKDRASWWRDYLLDNDGPGFDIVEHAPEYRDFMEQQADLVLGGADGVGLRVLELGAGTGNLTRRLIERGAEVVATDLVPEAIAALRAKIPDDGGRLSTAIVDLDGTPAVAWRRFLAGDIGTLGELAERIPGMQRSLVAELVAHDGDAMRAVWRGHAVDVVALAKSWRLGSAAARLLADAHVMGRWFSGHIGREEAQAGLGIVPPAALEAGGGLPFADQSFDAVGLSLVLSYVNHPEDCLFEIRRVLKPGGRLMLSSMVRDAESSKMYLDLIGRLEAAPDSAFAGFADAARAREHLKAGARRFADHAAELYRLEEEGLFRFYDGRDLKHALACRGFLHPRVDHGFGQPPQAVIVTCKRS
jgi:ubiquinone/menaquinone biosynthesis C-methylase UbiE